MSTDALQTISIKGPAPFSAADVAAIAAIEHVTDVVVDTADASTLTATVPLDTALARIAVTTVAKMFPNTPVQWSSKDAI